MTDFTFQTEHEVEVSSGMPLLEIPVEVVYEVDRGSVKLTGVYAQDDQGDFEVELQVDQEDWDKFQVQCIEDHNYRCEVAEAQAEDAAEARAEARREERLGL